MSVLRSRSALAVALVAGLVLPALVVASPASAHAGLVGSDPESRSSQATMPSEVRLTFTEEMNRPSFVTVTAPDGATIVEGEGRVEGHDVVQPVPDPGLAGTYRIDYRVISADGHPVSGAIEFDVTSGESVAQGAVDRITGSSAWWIGLVAVPWVVLLGYLVLRRQRSRA